MSQSLGKNYTAKSKHAMQSTNSKYNHMYEAKMLSLSSSDCSEVSQYIEKYSFQFWITGFYAEGMEIM